MKARYAVAIAALAVACSSVRPAPIQVGDRCYRCKAVISDVRIAAELMAPNNTPYPFRTPGCLAKYLKAHPGEQGTAFVTDNKTGYLIEAENAWFASVAVPAADGHGNEPDYLAFRRRVDAEAANATHAPLQRWTTIVATATE